jgi:hypothetical protein
VVCKRGPWFEATPVDARLHAKYRETSFLGGRGTSIAKGSFLAGLVPRPPKEAFFHAKPPLGKASILSNVQTRLYQALFNHKFLSL